MVGVVWFGWLVGFCGMWKKKKEGKKSGEVGLGLGLGLRYPLLF